MSIYQEIGLDEISGVKIGHAQDERGVTGCTVIVCEKRSVCGVDIRGGGPASRETQLLNPLMSNDGVDAVMLSGGSAYGLDAAGGVMRYLEERGRGVQVGSALVPIVVGSCIFDLNFVDGSVRPDAAMGYAACVDSERNETRCGNVGAGTGATVGKLLGENTTMKAGLGCYAVKLGELMVGAIVAVNAIGDVFEMDSSRQLAGLMNPQRTGMISSEEAMVQLMQAAAAQASNTTIGAVITNARLDKAAANKAAAMASNGLARTIRPVNTSMDGDSVYALSVGGVPASGDVVGTMAAHVMGKAVERAVLSAKEIHGYKAACSFR